MNYWLVALGLALVCVGYLCIVSSMPDAHFRGMPLLTLIGALFAGAGVYLLLAMP